jgi:WD40 repeat protein
LAGSKDGAIIVWSLPDFERIKILQGHSSLVKALKVTPDGKHFLSSSHDGVKVWDLEFLTEVSQFTTVVWEPHPLSIVSACLTSGFRLNSCGAASYT